MNGRERFETALRLGEPDMVPTWELAFIESAIFDIARHFSDDVPPTKLLHEMNPMEMLGLLKSLFLIVEKMDLDGFTLPVQAGNEVVGEDRVKDKLGIVYIPSDNGLALPVSGPVRTREELEAYRRPRVDDTWFMAWKMAESWFRGERAVTAMPPDPWKTYWAIQGDLTEALVLFHDDPELARGIMRLAADITIDVVREGAKLGVRYFCIAGDLAMNTGPMISPAVFRDFIKPLYREIVDEAHAAGTLIIKHSCGNVTALLDDFLDCGFDGIHPIQPQCMDLAAAKEKCRGRAAVLGNIDCVHVLPSGTPEEVEAAVREAIRAGAPGGGYVLASSNSIHKDVRSENAIAMFSAARRLGKYPIGI